MNDSEIQLSVRIWSRNLTIVFRTVVIMLLTAAAVSACSSAKPVDSAAGTRVTVSVGQCGTGWNNPVAGHQHFLLVNTDTRSGEVLLTDALTGAAYADVEPIGPGTTTDLDINLGSGRYAFRCAMEDESTVVGPTVTIPGHTPRPVNPVQPVAQGDLIRATKSYEAYVNGQIPTLVHLTAALTDAISAGNLAAARTAWLPAHLEYERLGAAYDAFGDLDTDINGLPNGLPGGESDADWLGFHRIEYGLWNGQSALSLRPSAQALTRAVGQLGTQFAKAQIDPLEVSIRAHEIMENALQFELTAQTDFGSHSNLATVRANLDGTGTVLNILHPLLATRYPQLRQLTAAITSSQHDLDALRAGGVWPALTTLTRNQRERIDADISNLCELLAPVASILEPRRDS